MQVLTGHWLDEIGENDTVASTQTTLLANQAEMNKKINQLFDLLQGTNLGLLGSTASEQKDIMTPGTVEQLGDQWFDEQGTGVRRALPSPSPSGKTTT